MVHLLVLDALNNFVPWNAQLFHLSVNLVEDIFIYFGMCLFIPLMGESFQPFMIPDLVYSDALLWILDQH